MSSRAGLAISKGLSLVCSLAVVACLMPRPVAAQAVTGTLLGTVTDTTGAVLPGATVTVTNTDTGYSRTVTADASGEYAVPSLPTGTYTVAGELSGFKSVQMSNIRVGVDQRVRIDLRLEVGEMT